jgi:NitT/TauT family transport system ATP-binding protein
MDNPPGSSNSSANVSATSESAPLPQIGISEILGLVELLKSKGGREDIYKLAGELQMEFGDMLTVIRGAELLGLVNTPGGDVTIEPLGEKASRSRINARKTIIKEQLERLPVFKKISEFLTAKDDHQATRDEILEKLAELIPNENVEQTFSTLINWGRYAELFGYNDDTATCYLDKGDAAKT